MGQDIRLLVRDYAVENFKNGLNCAESVFDALLRGGALNLPKETVGMSTGFGGGTGLCGGMCGALSAAIMANGAVYGRFDPWKVDPAVRAKEATSKYYRRYNKMVHEFIAQNGSMNCQDICVKFPDWQGKERRLNCLELIANTAVLAYDFLQMTQEEAFLLPYGKNVAGFEK